MRRRRAILPPAGFAARRPGGRDLARTRSFLGVGGTALTGIGTLLLVLAPPSSALGSSAQPVVAAREWLALHTTMTTGDLDNVSSTRHRGTTTTTTSSSTTTTHPTTTTSTTTTTHPSTTTTTTHPTTTTSTSTTTTTTAAPGAMAAPSGYSSSELVFDDSFAGTSLNKANWNTYVTSGTADGATWYGDTSTWSAIGPPNNGVNLEDYVPSHVQVDNGLSLSATRGSAQSGYSWTSGMVDTQGLFSFTGGYMQIKAQMPDSSSGMWPALWFLPAEYGPSSENTDEIDLDEAGFLLSGVNTNDIFASNLHTPGNAQTVVNLGKDLSAGYHVYGIQYLPGKSVTMYLDGTKVATYTTNVPSDPMELIINLAVTNASWHSATSSATPSPAVMRVAEVQAYS